MFLSRLFDPARNSQERLGNRRTKKSFGKDEARFWFYWGQWRTRRDQWEVANRPEEMVMLREMQEEDIVDCDVCGNPVLFGTGCCCDVWEDFLIRTVDADAAPSVAAG